METSWPITPTPAPSLAGYAATGIPAASGLSAPSPMSGEGDSFPAQDAAPPSDPTLGKDELLDLEAVQRSLGRSRASIYRYTNKDPKLVNPPYNPKTLNPEYRHSLRDPLLFHPNEVARFARDVLKMKQVTVEVLSSPQTATQETLDAILQELKAIRMLLENRS